MWGSLFSAGMGTVLVVTISATSGWLRSRSMASPVNRPWVLAMAIRPTRRSRSRRQSRRRGHWRGMQRPPRADVQWRRWPEAHDRVSTLSHLRALGRAWRRPLARGGGLLVLFLLVAAVWLATTDDSRVWPARNTLQYRLSTWWWTHTAPPERGATGSLRGTVHDRRGAPIAQATVLVSRWDGTTYSARSGGDGSYAIAGIPAGRYAPAAGAPGYGDVELSGPAWLPWGGVSIRAGAATQADVTLAPLPPPPVAAGTSLQIGEPESVVCQHPIESAAVRRQITFQSGGRPNQLTFLYTAAETSAENGAESGSGLDVRRPALLAVYPGPADEWECVSLPLAAAGYAVVAIGPAYSFDLEGDVDELQRLLDFLRGERLPGADGERIGLLAGSYSSLHVERLLARSGRASVRAALLLGPIADLFDMRRRLEDRSFVPPFGLDEALVALGFPDRAPLRYWRYSAAYHVRRDWPPIGLIHSRSDDVVPAQQSEALAAALGQAGVPYELHVLEGGGHYLLSEDAEARVIYDLALAFLKSRV